MACISTLGQPRPSRLPDLGMECFVWQKLGYDKLNDDDDDDDDDNVFQKLSTGMRAASRRSVLYWCSRELRAHTDSARDKCSNWVPASTGSRPRAGECSPSGYSAAALLVVL